jgi:hypothetical protein
MPRLKLRPEWDLGNPPRVVNQEIGDYEAGNYQTVDIMCGIARKYAGDPRIRQLALKILQGMPSHNFLDEARALAEFVQGRIRYVRDPNNIEQLHDPIYLLNQIVKGTAQGDCDDQALFLATLLLSVGAEPLFAIVRYKHTDGPFNHIYVVLYDKNWNGQKRRVCLDTIIKDRSIGFEVPFKTIEEIPV